MIRITQQEFESKTTPIARNMCATERAWYKDGDQWLGTVLLDNTDNDWSFVALDKDQTGKFRAIDMGASFPSEKAATEALAKSLWKTAREKIPGFVDEAYKQVAEEECTFSNDYKLTNKEGRECMQSYLRWLASDLRLERTTVSRIASPAGLLKTWDHDT